LTNDFDKKRKVSDYMGGSGSGNWYRSDSKTLVEHCLCIDVLRLNREGYLKLGLRYTWQWQKGTNIVIETKPDGIDLLYGISRNGQPREDIHIEVPLSWSSCNYGKKRPWFICPSKGCGRRVAKLYLEGKYFLCRNCHDLAYASQRERKEFRLLNKANKIYQRLGIKDRDDIYIKSKPKGMHQATYDLLCDKALDIECKGMQEVMKKINNI
jgi:hypothetical protein